MSLQDVRLMLRELFSRDEHNEEDINSFEEVARFMQNYEVASIPIKMKGEEALRFYELTNKSVRCIAFQPVEAPMHNPKTLWRASMCLSVPHWVL